jgi:hypothetical protein
MLNNTERAIKNGQSRESGNIGHTRHKTKTQKKRNKSEVNLCARVSSSALVRVKPKTIKWVFVVSRLITLNLETRAKTVGL